jgi:tRNA(Ile)-lysidine synthase TilS/MesJ
MDDVIETLLMSQIFEGRINTFSPVTFLDRKAITLIRPLIYAEEKLVRTTVRHLGLNPVGSGCPADGGTKRQNVKELITSLTNENRHIKANLFGAVQRAGICGWKLPETERHYED